MSIEQGDLPTRDRLKWAIDVMARTVLAHAAERVQWEDWPEIGEGDWERVAERVDELTPFPYARDIGIAYEWLEERAKHADS